VEVKDSPIEGIGVFAKRDFHKDEVIGIVSGFVPEELDPECWYTCEFEDDWGNWYAVEPTYPFRYLNHSANPNANMTSPVLIAVKAIKAGEEITFDYGYEDDIPF